MAADLVTKVLDEHERIRTHFSLLQDAAPSQREGLFRELVTLLVRHEAVESIVLHPTVEAHVPDGERLADQRRAEERQAEERLAELSDMDTSSDVFASALEAFQKEVLEHAQAEEEDVLPRLREHADPAFLQELGERYEQLKATAPTHPHPESGQGMFSNLFAGPVVGLIDRLRDAMTERFTEVPAARAPAAGGGHAYEDRSVEELRERAAEVDIEGRSTMDKAELISALRRHNR